MIIRLLVAFASFTWFLLHSFFSPILPDSRTPSLDDIYSPFEELRTDIEDYAWPTEASTVLTSGFAEFRTTHFHAGIDISTWNRTGYKVFASRDGYVAWISISPYGYGKMLLLRHADGYHSLYAHLSSFGDAIERLARKAQYENERYSVDIDLSPNEIPVRKGDVIAFTGNTGIGSPHLHFEIRDERLNPVNPFLVPLYGELVEDTTPPVFQEIAFTPLAHSSVVQGDLKPWISRVKRHSSTDYRLNTPVHLTGSVGISVKAFDRANHPYHRNTIRTLELFVDTLLRYRARLDRFPSGDSKQVALYYDWSLFLQRKGRFQKLHIEPGNRLPLYERLPEGSGVLETSMFSEGPHAIRVVAYDDRGHSSEMKGTIIFSRRPDFQIKVDNDSIYLQQQDASTTQSVRIGRFIGNQWRVRTIPLASLTSTESGYPLPVHVSRGNSLRIELENQFGTISAPRFIVASSKAVNGKGSIKFKKEFLHDYLYLTITSPSVFLEEPRVTVSHEADFTECLTIAKGLRDYVATIPFSLVQDNRLHIEVSAITAGGLANETLEIPIYPVTPEEDKIISANEDVTLHFPQDAVYHPTFIRVEASKDGYSLHPQGLVLNKGVEIQYRLRELVDPPALFASEESGWDLLAQADMDDQQILSGRLARQLADIALFHDTLAPSISGFSSRYRNGRLSFSFSLSDHGSGVDYNRTRIELDDELVIAPYDPYRRVVEFNEPLELSQGAHRLSIKIFDKTGNRSARNYHVRAQLR